MPTAISQLNSTVQIATLAAGDLLAATDVSDTTESVNGTTKPLAASTVDAFIFAQRSVDEDNMASNSATKWPTQQSTKAYVDALETEYAATTTGLGAAKIGVEDSAGNFVATTVEAALAELVTYVDTQVASLVDSSPATLDTLNELAAALGDDPNFSTTMTNSLAGKQATDPFLDDISALTDPNADRLLFWDDSAGDILWLTPGTGLSITTTTMAVDASAIDHDSLSGFVANEHINHTSVTLTAGAGLTGGGDISANRSFAVGAGTGIAVNADDVALSHLGLESLTDPNADRVLFWDDTAGVLTWLTMGTNLTITGTTLDAASGGGDSWGDAVDADIIPDTDSLRDLGSATTAFANLHVDAIEFGTTTDTTIVRSGAGDISIEGNVVYRAGGTDVAIADGGTGASTAAAAFSNLKQAATTSATGVVERATTAEIRAGTATTYGAVVDWFDAAHEVTLTDSATIAVDLSTGFNFTVTLAGNRTLGSPTLQEVGQSGYITVKQDATGSRTLAYHADWDFEGGTAPTLTTTASAVDVLGYVVTADGPFIYAAWLDVK